MEKGATKDSRACGDREKPGKMTRKKSESWMRYKKRTVERMKAVGTYRAQFGAAIERVADLYVQLDELDKLWSQDGRELMVEHTNKAGATNLAKHPLLDIRDGVYTQLLAHERELGLTPSALKKINDGGVQPEKKSTLAAALEKLGG